MKSHAPAVTEFEKASKEHFGTVADRYTLRFHRIDHHFFVMVGADISIHIRFFEPFSTPGYDVFVGITPRPETRPDPSDQRGLVWFARHLGITGLPGAMPEDGLFSVAEIPVRVEKLAQLTSEVLERIFAAGPEFWLPFYSFVDLEIAKTPEPSWMKEFKKETDNR